MTPTCPDCSHPIDDAHQDRADGTCERCDDAAQLGTFAPCQTSDQLPAGAQDDDDPEAFAAELVAEYAAAIERVQDRAQEARIAGPLTTCRLFHRATGAIGYGQDITPTDANGLRRDRAARDFADDYPAGYADDVNAWPILRALAESATQQTRSTKP